MGRSGAARALETAVRNFPMTALTQRGESFSSRLLSSCQNGGIRRHQHVNGEEGGPQGSNTGQPLLPHLSKAAVLLLPKCWQAAQGGYGGVTSASAGLSGGGLAVDAVVVPVQVVVTR